MSICEKFDDCSDDNDSDGGQTDLEERDTGAMGGPITDAARQSILASLLIAWALMEGATRAEAQDLGGGGWNSRGAAPTGGYRSRPTLSPYLDLLRTDSGVLPPYHAFVVPRRRIEQQQSRQWQAIGELKRQAVGQAGGDQEPLPTGGGGRFQTYLHYYPMGGRN